jgi:hypothetical protein
MEFATHHEAPDEGYMRLNIHLLQAVRGEGSYTYSLRVGGILQV